MTEHARMVLRVKQSGRGDFWICLEPLEKKLTVLRKGFSSFDLPEGTTINKAEEIAAFLQENIRQRFLHTAVATALRSRGARKGATDTIGDFVPVTDERVAGVGALHAEPKY